MEKLDISDETTRNARQLVCGLTELHTRRELSAEYVGKVFRWIDLVAPEITKRKTELAVAIAVECKNRRIKLAP